MMGLRFIIGRSGSGKTTCCLNEIRGHLQAQSAGKPLILLVPEQATFQAEYALVTTPGLQGIIRVQVLSFRRLAFRIMQETGGTALTHIADTGKKMLLHKILRDCRDAEQMNIFAGSAEQAGFIDKLNELFTEFKRYRLTPDELNSPAHVNKDGDAFQEKWAELAEIYRRFTGELSSHYVDSEDYLQLLAEHMTESEYIREAEIWIDGFHGFTPQELAVVSGLLNYAKNVHIALTLDREYTAFDEVHELDLFHPTARTMIKLQGIAEETGIDRMPTIVLESPEKCRYARSPRLAHLERHYGSRSRWLGPEGAQFEEEAARTIQISSAVHRRAEIEGAAREMLRLAREQQCRWRDMTVRVRHLEGYADLIETIFADYEIPCFIDRKRSVMHHPLVEFIRSALEIVNRHWRYDAVFRCIKTDFLLPFVAEAPIAPEDGPAVEENRMSLGEAERVLEAYSVHRRGMDQLENYVLAFGIHGSRWTDAAPWKAMLNVSLDEEEQSDSVRSEGQQQYLKRINYYRSLVVKPLFTFQKAMAKSLSVRDKIAALFDLLSAAQIPEKLAQWSDLARQKGDAEVSRQHSQLWDETVEVLDQMVELMGDEDVSLETFAELLETGLESIRLGMVPPALDQVLIGSIDRSRTSDIHHLFVLGVNDGILPAKAKEDGLLTEAERERLAAEGLELAPDGRRKLLDEQFLAYLILAAPADSLWLSYPLADDEGKSLQPSEVIRNVANMFSLQPQLLMGEPAAGVKDEEQLPFIAHPERTLSHTIVQLHQYMKGTVISEVWWDAYNWFCRSPRWRKKLHVLLDSLFYNNRESALSAETSHLLYGAQLTASVSRMEKHAACPFAQFASYGLRLKERRVFRLEAPDIGQLFHAALRLIAVQLEQDRMEWAELDAEQCAARAAVAVDELSPRLQNDILFSSNRNHQIARKLKAIVGRAAAVLSEHARRGDFSPVALEVAFGPGLPLPPLRFDLPNGCTMEVVGRIDRVDRADGEGGALLRIIDYKSSSKTLALADVVHGLSLQMLTYLDVVVTYAEDWLGAKAAPAGVLYFHIHNPLLQKKYPPTAEEAEAELFGRFKMRGLVRADLETVRLMDNRLESGYSEILPVAVKKDGQFYSSAAVATDEEWDILRSFVRGTIRRIGTSITDGTVAIEPYRSGKASACMFCAFRPVCQFDPLIEGNQYHKLPYFSKEEAWNAMKKQGGEALEDKYAAAEADREYLDR